MKSHLLIFSMYRSVRGHSKGGRESASGTEGHVLEGQTVAKSSYGLAPKARDVS